MEKRIVKFLSVIVLSFFFSIGLALGAEPITVGIVWPFTGPIAASGAYLKGAVEIGVDKINSEGGIIGRPLKIFMEDGANDPAQSVSAAEKLITKEKVDVFMGCWGSSPTLAVSASVTKKYGIPHLVETSSSDKMTKFEGKRPNPWLFRISPTSGMEAVGAEPYMVPKMGFTKVAFLPVNNDWGRGAAEQFGNVIKRSGGQVVTTEVINADATDFLTQLTKIRGTDANSIIITSDMAQVSLVLKQYKQLGMTQKVLVTGGSIVPDGLAELAGPEAAEGVYMISFFVRWNPELTKIPEEAKWFVEEYLKRGNPAKGFSECYRAYDGLKAIKAAIEIAGTTDKDAVRIAFAKVDTWGLTGRIKFDEFGQSYPTIRILQVKDGKHYVPEFMR